MGHAVTTVLAIVVIAVVLALLGFLLRLRRLAGRVGSFECAMRTAGDRRWMSGIATFGDEVMTWSRLISLSPRPRMTIERRDLVLESVRHRGRAHRIVDVSCLYEGRPLDLAMLEDSHSALVAWLESAPPHQPTLF